MGFHLRKSIRVGPFRFNFSTCGIGVSAGVRGKTFKTAGSKVEINAGLRCGVKHWKDRRETG
jgi:hypothetical protein